MNMLSINTKYLIITENLFTGTKINMNRIWLHLEIDPGAYKYG